MPFGKDVLGDSGLREKKVIKTVVKRAVVVGLLSLMGGVIGINAIAWMQARAMTRYATVVGNRTAQPETLSIVEKVSIVLTGVRVPRPINERTPEAVGLAFETHQVVLENAETLEAWFVPSQLIGTEQVPRPEGLVLLFPPYGGSKQSLLSVALVFHELGYDTLLVDYRGVGGSSGRDTTLGVREAKDVAHAMTYAITEVGPGSRQRPAAVTKETTTKEATTKETTIKVVTDEVVTDEAYPIILYGASLGAAAVMRAIAHEGVTPAAVILESPFDRLLSTVRNRFEAMGLPAFPGAELIVWWGSWQQGIDGFSHNPVEYAAAMHCPVLLMYGEHDQRVMRSEIESIFERLPEHKQFVVFPLVGHGALVIEAPERWREQVSAFLASL